MSLRFERERNMLWLPADAPTAGVRAPLILFLHGKGERGAGGVELDRTAAWGLPKLRRERRLPLDPFPFDVLAPQCPDDVTWCDESVLSALDALLEEITRPPGPAALYLAGFSMGGYGAYCLALRHPHRFAALVSVCGKCFTPERLDTLAHLPQWVAWAEDDEIGYLTEGSREIVARLQGSGKVTARPYRLGAEGEVWAHVRTADAAFAELNLYSWLQQQGRA